MELIMGQDVERLRTKLAAAGAVELSAFTEALHPRSHGKFTHKGTTFHFDRDSSSSVGPIGRKAMGNSHGRSFKVSAPDHPDMGTHRVYEKVAKDPKTGKKVRTFHEEMQPSLAHPDLNSALHAAASRLLFRGRGSRRRRNAQEL